jgi:hypothetical protein
MDLGQAPLVNQVQTIKSEKASLDNLESLLRSQIDSAVDTILLTIADEWEQLISSFRKLKLQQLSDDEAIEMIALRRFLIAQKDPDSKSTLQSSIALVRNAVELYEFFIREEAVL